MDQCVKCPDHQYTKSEKTHCLQNSMTFLAYEDLMGVALVCIAIYYCFLTAIVLSVFVKHQDMTTVEAN